MEYLAGFYVVLGFLIIVFKSEFLKNGFNKVMGRKTNFGKLDQYYTPNKMVLQKIPVIVKKDHPFGKNY